MSNLNNNNTNNNSSLSIDIKSDAETVQAWLKKESFSEIAHEFQDYTGEDFLSLTKKDLILLIGKREGIRLFNKLLRRKSTKTHSINSIPNPADNINNSNNNTLSTPAKSSYEHKSDLESNISSFGRLFISDNIPSTTPQKLPRDGVRLNDQFLLTRDTLRQQILSYHKLLVTAPPASGKTSMLQLLVETLRSRNMKVLTIDAGAPDITKDKEQYDSDIIQARVVTKMQLYNKSIMALDQGLDYFDWILVDEAHRLYQCDTLITYLIKSPRPARIIFFASTSCYGTGAASPAFPDRLTWQDFKLLDNEVEILKNKILNHPHYKEHYSSWLPDILPQLLADADHHIGLIRLFLEELTKQFSRESKQTFEAAEVAYYYYGNLFSANISRRFFYPFKNLTEMQKRIIQDLILGKEVSAPRNVQRNQNESEEDQAKRWLLRGVILVDVENENKTDMILEFATPLHRRFFFREAYPSCIDQTQFDTLVNNNIDEWLLMVLRTFNPDKLKNRQSWGKNEFPKEAVFQFEFWRGASKCLPPNVRIAPEVSRIEEKEDKFIKGEIDFWINSSLRWGIELLRLGDRKQEHINRFTPSGKYAPLKPSDYRIVDFVPSDYNPKVPKEKYVLVKIKEDYSGASVVFESGRSEEIQFVGDYIPKQN